MKAKTLIAALVLFFVAALAALSNSLNLLQVSPDVLAVTRWVAIAALILHALFHRTLTTWIVAGMVVGAEIGHDFPAFAVSLRLLAQIFLRLIKVIIAPLLFGTLVSGIAGHADLKKVGRMGIKALLYFEVVTTLALLIGLAAINVSRAGVGAQITTGASEQLNVQKMTVSETILHVFPENLAKSVAENQILQVVVFSVTFGIALAMVGAEKRRPMLAFAESLTEVMFKFTKIVMLFAPLGVLGAIASTVGSTGLGVLGNLAKLLATLYVALAAFLLLVLLPIALVAKIPLRRFLRAVSEPASIAFATANSEAALPLAMENMEAFGVSRPTVAFILPTGYSFNLDGSALYLSLAAIFVAQAAGMHLRFGQQLYILLVLMLTSKGVAGVARASLVVLLATASSVGLPTEPIFILLGIDQLMDMGRTAVNLVGNCLATVVIARWEGDFHPDAAASLETSALETSA